MNPYESSRLIQVLGRDTITLYTEHFYLLLSKQWSTYIYMLNFQALLIILYIVLYAVVTLEM